MITKIGLLGTPVARIMAPAIILGLSASYICKTFPPVTIVQPSAASYIAKTLSPKNIILGLSASYICKTSLPKTIILPNAASYICSVDFTYVSFKVFWLDMFNTTVGV